MLGSIATTAPEWPAQALHRRPLGRHRQAGDHVVARHRLALQLVADPAQHGREVGVGGGQVVVLGQLQPGAPGADRVVPDRVAEQRPQRIAAQEHVQAVLRALGVGGQHRVAVGGQDQPALDLQLPVDQAGVVLPGGQARRRPDLPVGGERDQHQAGARAQLEQGADARIHLRTLRGARRHHQEQRQQHEVRDHGAAAVADERQGDAGQRDQAGDAADDQEGLQHDREREPRGQELREAVIGDARDLEAAIGEQQVDQQHPGGSGQPGLVGPDRVDAVGLGGRDHRAAVAEHLEAAAQPGAEDAAVGDRLDRLDDLVAVGVRGLPGVEPDLEALLHVRGEAVDQERSAHEQRQPGHRVQLAAGRDVDHRQEDAVQEQRRAHVVHHRDHAQRHARHRQQRPQVPGGRQAHPQDPAVRHRQQLPLLAQVAGQEDHQQQLCELARLHLHAAHPQPQLGAVDGRAHQHRDHQQRHRRHAQRVLVRLQLAVVSDQQDQGQEPAQADHDPDRLIPGQQRVQAIDLGQAHRRQERRQRQQPGIRVRQPRAQPQVRHEVERQEERGVDQRGAGDLLLARRVHAQEADAREDGDREQVPELAEARGSHGPELPALSATERALASERIVWSNSFLRVAWSSAA